MRLFIFAAGLAVSLSGLAMADDMTGYVSDSHCGAKHNTVSEANTKCVKGCLKSGDPVLVSGDKVYKIDSGSRDKVMAFAGQNVKVDGTLDGDTVKINSVEASK